MKIMICGGGTVGHINPGLALAEALKKIDGKTEIVFVGSAGGLETEAVPKAGYRLEVLPIKGLPRKVSLRAAGFLFGLGASTIKAGRLLKEYEPAVVIGMGGFAAFPLSMVASLKGIPLVIHEQNAVPGLANRWLARRAQITALTFPDDDRRLKGARLVEVVGNPIRAEVLSAQRQEAVEKLQLDERPITVLIFGGSRGARRLNTTAIEAYDMMRHAHNLQIIQVTGMMDYEQIKAKLETVRQPQDTVKYHLFPYLSEMGQAYAAADLVVCRAGATTLAEVTARGLPSILVPYPHATDDHQAKNASWAEAAGAAKVIKDENLNSQLLWQAISNFIYHPSSLREMAVRAGKLGRPRAAKTLARLIFSLAGKNPDAEREKGTVHGRVSRGK